MGSVDALQFRIDRQPGETQRARMAIAQASLPPSRRSAIMIGLYGAIIVLAFVLTPSTRYLTIVIGVGAVLATEALLRREVRPSRSDYWTASERASSRRASRNGYPNSRNNE